jgi:surfeit locus 1 family protein
LLIPALLAFVVLIGLGSWQLQRKAWKEGLIAALDAQLAAPPLREWYVRVIGPFID